MRGADARPGLRRDVQSDGNLTGSVCRVRETHRYCKQVSGMRETAPIHVLCGAFHAPEHEVCDGWGNVT
jgi:hypothetical protein